MPIKVKKILKPLSHDNFHTMDYRIMGIIYSIHRDMGRFWNEKIYQNELAFRCQQAGINDIATEQEIVVSFRDFRKYYSIDLLINNAIYELKTAKQLTAAHQKQTINYLMLTRLNYAKLVNLRQPSVQYRFVSTQITPEKRYDYRVDDKRWQNIDKNSEWLKDMFIDLLNEWGVFLEIDLFYQAIAYFKGGKESIVKKILVKNGPRILGTQKVHLISPDIAFKITALTKKDIYYEKHLYKILNYTPLQAIHWINFNHNKISFTTIQK